MAYKLAEEDKLCGVIYPTYEGFSPIPKATCEMLESKCEQTIIVTCKDNQSEEGKKPESQSGSASASASESSSESNSVSNSVSESTSVSNSESESSSNTGSETPTPEEEPDVERDNLTTELRGLTKKVNLGYLSVDDLDGYYRKADNNQIDFLGLEVDKIREKYPDYTIEYTLQYPEEEPKVSFTEEGYKDKNKYLSKFTITRGSKSTEVPVYMPFNVIYTDHL